MQSDRLYSKFIGGMKILLPMAALGLLSTMFMISQGRETALDISTFLSANGGSDLVAGISKPKFASTTTQGDSVLVQAEQARPIEDGLVAAYQVAAEIDLIDGSAISLSALKAAVMEDGERIDLEGSVHMESSTGYHVATEAFQMQTNRVSGQTLSPIEATGPAGSFRADRMVVTQNQDTGDVQLHFTGNVKLVYLPLQE